MIDELINEVSAKTGISQDQARIAVEAVLGVLKNRLPPPLASGLESVVGGTASAHAESGSGETSGEGGGLVIGSSALLGSLFGNKG